MSLIGHDVSKRLLLIIKTLYLELPTGSWKIMLCWQCQAGEILVHNTEVKGLGMQPSAFLFIIYISVLPKSHENVPFLC